MNEARHLESLTNRELSEIIWETQESDLIENFEALKVIWERAFEADEVESALAWTKRMQEVARKLDSPVREALALHSMGMVQHILNHFDDAISCLYQAEKIYGINLHFKEQCRVNLQLAEVFDTSEDYLAKLSSLEVAREIAVREELVFLAGQACMEIAISLHYDMNSLSQGFNEENSAFAFEMAEEANGYFANAGKEVEIAVTRMLQGHILDYQDKPEQALSMFRQSYAHWTKVTESQDCLIELGSSALAIANILSDLDRNEEAKDYFAASLTAFSDSHSGYDISRCNIWIGVWLTDLCQHEQALTHFEKALERTDDVYNLSTENFIYFSANHHIALNLYYLGREVDAIVHINEILNEYAEEEYFINSFLIDYLMTAASAAADLGKWDIVLQMLGKGNVISAPRRDIQTSIAFDSLKVRALLGIGNIGEALNLANAVIGNLEGARLTNSVGHIYEIRAQITAPLDEESSRSDYAKAESIYLENGNLSKANRIEEILLPTFDERKRAPWPANKIT